jgi:uncharacterized protein (TIGR01777 family)
MHVLITGGTGFIGEALRPALLEDGHTLTILTRQSLESMDRVAYVRSLDEVDLPVDAVINLAGASLAGRRWNSRYKAEIIDSRIGTTRALGDFFERAGPAPSVWLNASAIGYYGPRDDEVVDEQGAAGEGFSAELCRDWEAAAREAAGEGTRLCVLRLGVVFDRDGGAYPQIAAPFRMGVANWIGDGHQYLSWVHRGDVVAAMRHLLGATDLVGVFNVAAPTPVTSRELCDAMKRVHRTFITLPMPAAAMRLMVGEMADELLITGQRVVPARLSDSGFKFAYATIDAALAAIEGR